MDPPPSRLAHQCCQSLSTLAEVDGLGRHHHAHSAGRSDHAAAFNARSTAPIVPAAASRPMRAMMPSISSSIDDMRAADMYSGCRTCLEDELSLIHISEPTRRTPISYAVF